MKRMLWLVMMVAVCGCTSVNWRDWISFKKPDPVVIAIPTTTTTTQPPAVQEVKEWPSYYAPDFFRPSSDENESANDYRWASLEAAKKAGLDCLKIKPNTDAMNDERAMHLLHMSHPERPDYFLGSENWYNRAQGFGVKRYIIEIRNEDRARWKYLTRDYPPNSLQWVIDGKVYPSL